MIVEFGATWCPSCRSLQKQLPSLLQSQDNALDYAATFELIEIGISTIQFGRLTDVPSGHVVLAQLLATARGVKLKSVPFLAVIDPSNTGRTVTRNLDDLELQAGGYDPVQLREFLRLAHAHITGNGAAPSEPGWFARKFSRGWQRLFGG